MIRMKKTNILMLLFFWLYWLLLGVVIDSFSVIETSTLQLFYPNFRDLRYFYLLPYFIGRFSIVLSILLSALLLITFPVTMTFFPNLIVAKYNWLENSSLLLVDTATTTPHSGLFSLGSDFIQLQIQLLDELVILWLLLSMVTWIFVTVMEKYYSNSFSILIVCLLTTSWFSYAVRIESWIVIIIVLVVFFLEGAQLVVFKEKYHVEGNKEILFFKQSIPFAVILPLLFIILLRLVCTPIGNWFFVISLVAFIFVLLSANFYNQSPLLIHHEKTTFYLTRNWLIKNIFFGVFLLLWLQHNLFITLNIFLCWVLLRLLVRLL